MFYGNLDNRFSDKDFKTENSIFIARLNKQLIEFFLKVCRNNYDNKVLKSVAIFLKKV